jgi:hypothetical protein
MSSVAIHIRPSTEVGGGGGRRGDVLGVALDEAVSKLDDPPRPPRDVGLVRDHHDGDAALLVELGEQEHDLALLRGVEVAGGLVGEDERRLGDDGAGDRDALLLSAGELARGVVLAAGEADGVQRRERASASLAGRHATVHQRKLHVLERARSPEQVEALEDEPDVVATEQRELVEIELGDLDPAKEVRAGGRAIEAADDVHARRLAGAARADDRHELAVGDRERHAVERADLGVARAVDLRHVAQLDERLTGRRRHRPLPRCQRRARRSRSASRARRSRRP